MIPIFELLAVLGDSDMRITTPQCHVINTVNFYLLVLALMKYMQKVEIEI